MSTVHAIRVPTRMKPSVMDLYSPAMAFCAASAMITRIRMSPMPTAPMRRRMTKRKSRNRNQNMALPRTTSSSGEIDNLNSSDQSTLMASHPTP